MNRCLKSFVAKDESQKTISFPPKIRQKLVYNESYDQILIRGHVARITMENFCNTKSKNYDSTNLFFVTLAQVKNHFRGESVFFWHIIVVLFTL